MKYFIRVIKYFIYFSVILCLVLGVLTLLGLVEGNLNAIFRNGATDLIKIALIFLVISAVYPRVGFVSRSCKAEGDWSSIALIVKTYLEDRSLEVESEEENKLSFRQRTAIGKLSRMYEDRITVIKEGDTLTMEGPRKDVIRFCMGIDYLLNKEE